MFVIYSNIPNYLKAFSLYSLSFSIAHPLEEVDIHIYVIEQRAVLLVDAHQYILHHEVLAGVEIRVICRKLFDAQFAVSVDCAEVLSFRHQ